MAHEGKPFIYEGDDYQGQRIKIGGIIRNAQVSQVKYKRTTRAIIHVTYGESADSDMVKTATIWYNDWKSGVNYTDAKSAGHWYTR
jgi:hypothetical protein